VHHGAAGQRCANQGTQDDRQNQHAAPQTNVNWAIAAPHLLPRSGMFVKRTTGNGNRNTPEYSRRTGPFRPPYYLRSNINLCILALP
jgi:hypothetical protein